MTVVVVVVVVVLLARAQPFVAPQTFQILSHHIYKIEIHKTHEGVNMCHKGVLMHVILMCYQSTYNDREEGRLIIEGEECYWLLTYLRRNRNT